ncbi:phage baseplate assembly protein [Yersinia enterocolitica]|uniref:phage baseplate assembly protein domain-containing protein n=1 Tax=Yersinia enterocolitica TaxID=630 RepID=UPI0005E185C3|nr:phage baseplate assembly protein [Yersinia enterocolitica]EKN3461479.1 phage baseplate assembly protein [Yersinia enterocolitica]EKN3500597.1 phage baseplate assembly protein [Yersinia enterocolitica]EKN3850196.1 phage baseplate assembly protein [Yersinia enterocolitica]EKN3951131.1 phage baseplate assembly protein [Yersinia enterocolitica]EKN3971658.1 phage baseplate assembly protein [Yersinia enterocolitica]
MSESGQLSQLYRQIKMILGIGRVTASSDSGSVQTVQYQTPLEVRSDTPRLAEFGFSSGLPAGTDVVIGFLGGDRSSAVIIGSNHQSFRHVGLNSGETVIYSQWGQYVKLTEAGIIIEANDQPVTVNNTTEVTINAAEKVRLNTPLLEVSGDIVDNAGSNNTTLKTLREAYNAHNHQLKNVQGGSATLTSEVTGKVVK